MSVMIRSKLGGERGWGELVVYPGVNTISDSDYSRLKKEDGFIALVKKGTMEEMSNKEISSANKVTEEKNKSKHAIDSLKKVHADEMKNALAKLENEKDKEIERIKADFQSFRDQKLAEIRKLKSQLK